MFQNQIFQLKTVKVTSTFSKWVS